MLVAFVLALVASTDGQKCTCLPTGRSSHGHLKMRMNMTVSFLFVLAFLCAAGRLASAQVNLLPQGNFETPGVNTEWAEGFNIPNNEEFRVVSENGKHWLRIENRDPDRQLDYVHAYVKVTPQIASLTVSVRMRATDLKPGKEGWHTARVALMFEGGSFGYPREVPELRTDSAWITKSVELKVPAGATRLNIQPAMFHCTGVLEIADFTVTPQLVAPTQLADAVLPAGVTLNWDATDVEAVSGKRTRIRLDGIWRFARGPGDRDRAGAGLGLYQGARRLAESLRPAFLFPGPRWRPAVGPLRRFVGGARLVCARSANPGGVAGPHDQPALRPSVHGRPRACQRHAVRHRRLALGLRGRHAGSDARQDGGHPAAGGGNC